MRLRAMTLLAAVPLLAGCATAAIDAPAPSPTRPSELLTTEYPVTVVESGSGAEMCIGPTLLIAPPQCGRFELIGWDWSAHEGDVEQADGVRWGEFLLTGFYDAEAQTFEPATVVPRSELPDPVFSGYTAESTTPCAEPAGGWRVEDDSRVGDDDLAAAFATAEGLDGYGASWVDESVNPVLDEDPLPDDVDLQLDDPLYTIVNVTVTGETAAAEAAIREVWSGMLCVSETTRSHADLQEIAGELQSRDDVLGVGPDGKEPFVELTVVYDDGSIQADLDERYGAGVVVVTSELIPAD